MNLFCCTAAAPRTIIVLSLSLSLSRSLSVQGTRHRRNDTSHGPKVMRRSRPVGGVAARAVAAALAAAAQRQRRSRVLEYAAQSQPPHRKREGRPRPGWRRSRPSGARSANGAAGAGWREAHPGRRLARSWRRRLGPPGAHGAGGHGAAFIFAAAQSNFTLLEKTLLYVPMFSASISIEFSQLV